MKIAPLIAIVVAFSLMVSANHASLNLPQIVDTVNKNTESVPPQLMQLFGNERINTYFEDGAEGVVTKNGKITEYYNHKIDEPTLNVYLTSTVAKQLISGALDFNQAIQHGQLRYEAIDPVTKIKVIIAELARSIFSSFFH